MDHKRADGTSDPIWLETAQKEIGQKEVKGRKDNPRIVAYHAVTRAGEAADEVPWCSSFACWCFEQNGVRSTRSKSASSWLTWGKPCEPQTGCVVVFGKSDPDAKGTGHVAFLLGIDGDRVFVVGGNQQNAVTRAWRKRDAIVGCRWPLD